MTSDQFHNTCMCIINYVTENTKNDDKGRVKNDISLELFHQNINGGGQIRINYRNMPSSTFPPIVFISQYLKPGPSYDHLKKELLRLG